MANKIKPLRLLSALQSFMAMLLLGVPHQLSRNWNSAGSEIIFIGGGITNMTYADATYISIARNNEVKHHEHTMNQLQAKIAQLTKAVAWELEQHHARLKELQQAEDTLATSDLSRASSHQQPTLEPTPSSHGRWTHTRKFIHRSSQKPVAELVG